MASATEIPQPIFVKRKQQEGCLKVDGEPKDKASPHATDTAKQR